MFASVRRTGRLLVLEDCFENGSVGQQLAAALIPGGRSGRTVILKNLKHQFAGQGAVPMLRREAGLDAGGRCEGCVGDDPFFFLKEKNPKELLGTKPCFAHGEGQAMALK